MKKIMFSCFEMRKNEQNTKISSKNTFCIFYPSINNGPINN